MISYIHHQVYPVEPEDGDANVAAHVPQLPEFYDGAIDFVRLSDYTASSTRSLKSGFILRKIMFDNTEGRIEFSVATETNGKEVEARTTFQMEEAVAHMGAVYGFRSLEDRDTWLGEDNEYLSYICRSTPIQPDLFTVERIASSLASVPRI